VAFAVTLDLALWLSLRSSRQPRRAHAKPGVAARRARERGGMSWEAVSAISTAFTGIVILLTVIYAAKQVSVLSEQSKALAAQLEHLRRATQLDGTLAVFEEIFSDDYMNGYRFVMTEFEERMKDPTFHAEALENTPDVEKHKERQVMRHMERIGTLVKNDLLDGNVLVDFAGDVIEQTWVRLKPLALEHRREMGNERMWENFEFMALYVERWAATR
jgi:hypothetical protein